MRGRRDLLALLIVSRPMCRISEKLARSRELGMDWFASTLVTVPYEVCNSEQRPRLRLQADVGQMGFTEYTGARDHSDEPFGV